MVKEGADRHLFHINKSIMSNIIIVTVVGWVFYTPLNNNKYISFIRIGRLFVEHCGEVELASFAVWAVELKRVKPSDQREEREESVD